LKHPLITKKESETLIDPNIIQLVKMNDDDAFASVFYTYQQKVYKMAWLMLRDHQRAEDVVQETFLQVYTKINKLSNNMAFEKWLYKITVNHCYEIIRKHKKADLLLLDETIENFTTNSSVPHRELIQKEVRKKIITAIYDLPLKHRTVLILFYFNDLSIKEIAAIISKSEGTVKSRLFYGKKIIKNSLGENFNMDVDDIMGGIVYENR
jgi:RNA polymerase sigma-70 factor (ECF subfamily)